MPNYHHFDHLDRFAPGLKVGDKVKKGQLLGYVGRSGTVSPHLHYEIMVKKPGNWLQYTWNMTKEQVRALYIDPTVYKTPTLPMKWNKYGWKYLDRITRVKNGKTEVGYHPGDDLNFGSGADDLGFPAFATTDGIIRYLGLKETDGGAGNNLWWSEESTNEPEKPMNYENSILHNIQGKGEYAMIIDGKKRMISSARAGLAALTAQERAMKIYPVPTEIWNQYPEGEAF